MNKLSVHEGYSKFTNKLHYNKTLFVMNKDQVLKIFRVVGGYEHNM